MNPLRQQILDAAEDICKHSPSGTVDPRDIYHAIMPKWKGHRGRNESDRPLTLTTISRTLTSNGYSCIETRAHGYSRYKKLI